MNKKRGFTLIELIVVIAILAIIAAVAVPTAFGSIENARKAACNAQEDSIMSAWRLVHADKLLNNSSNLYEMPADLTAALKQCGIDKTVTPTTAAAAEYTIAGGCPVTDGNYKVKYSLLTHSITISCTKHGDAIGTKNPITGGIGSFGNLLELMKSVFNNTKQAMDSCAPTSTQSSLLKMMKGVLDAAGTACPSTDAEIIAAGEKILKNEYGMTSWKNNNDGLYWTSTDISTMNPGDTVTIMKYNYSNGLYTVWNVKVKSQKSTNVLPDGTYEYYNVLDTTGTQVTKDTDKKDDYNTILKIYQDELNK